MSFKNKLITWLINRKYSELKRNIQAVNLAEVKTAGILWRIDDHEVFKSLVNQLKEKGINVSSLCFADQPGSLQGETVFSPTDFSFFGKLKNSEVETFIDQKLDLLIDISLATEVEIQYVRALSKAKFKAGWSEASPDYFDLSIDISNNKKAAYLAEQLIHYLNEINKKQ